jgi:hypothetical protein
MGRPIRENAQSSDKEWYVILHHKQEGPFQLLELKKMITPDTLVWKKGFIEWTPARRVPELNSLFEDEPESKPLHEKPVLSPLKEELGQEQITLILQQDPYPFILWLLVFLLAIFYTFYHLNN